MALAVNVLVFLLVVNSLLSHTTALSARASSVLFCADPGTPENATRDDDLRQGSTQFLPGMQVIFTCDFTYKLDGSPNRTCLADGTWSGVQPTCKQYMCDELDAKAPKNGKRVGNFTIGGKVFFKCSSHYTLIGQKELACLPNGQWSGKPPTCRHLCRELKCEIGTKCKMINGSPKCVCRDVMDCSSRLNAVCGTDGKTYNNKCIMKALACKESKNVEVVKNSPCLPGDRCSILPQSNCRASFDVFYYDVTDGKCKRMIAGGCHPSGWNGFWTKKSCSNYCKRDVCIMEPDKGPCDDQLKRWYFDNQSNKCQVFDYGGCFGNPNNFRTKEDCSKRCI